jgi:hypothetical protein
MEGDFARQWINFHSLADPFINIELVLREFQQHPPRTNIVVILDGAEVLRRDDLHRVIQQFTSYNCVRNVIATSRHTGLNLPDVYEIELGYPEGKLYGLEEQTVSPEKRIVEAVAPTIVTFNDILIEQLKKSPTDLFKITSRSLSE